MHHLSYRPSRCSRTCTLTISDPITVCCSLPQRIPQSFRPHHRLLAAPTPNPTEFPTPSPSAGCSHTGSHRLFSPINVCCSHDGSHGVPDPISVCCSHRINHSVSDPHRRLPQHHQTKRFQPHHRLLLRLRIPQSFRPHHRLLLTPITDPTEFPTPSPSSGCSHTGSHRVSDPITVCWLLPHRIP